MVLRNNLDEKNAVWFVYDGECPLCKSTAYAFRMKQDYHTLHLVNARSSADEPIIQEINRHGLDLDEGMVIYADAQFYHGKEALKFMACYGEHSNLFTSVCKSLFCSDTMSALMYPCMRAVRNWLLRRNNIGRIHNLKKTQKPCSKQ